MIIETMDFGFVEIREEDIINFPLGVYAFREHKKFVVLQNPQLILENPGYEVRTRLFGSEDE